jgi:hypothetical protein
MRYVLARVEENQEAKAYRFYITDALMVISQNTGRIIGGSELTKSFRSILEGSTKDERSSEEIINDITTRLRAL